MEIATPRLVLTIRSDNAPRDRSRPGHSGICFKQFDAHRVMAFCNVLNAASWRVMEKLSMQCDGRLREERWWRGACVDNFVYSILYREWAEL